MDAQTTADRQSIPPTGPPAATPAGATITRPRGRPTGRAVVGALLVTVASVGTFALARPTDPEPGLPVLVAATEVGIGERLEADDLEVVRLGVAGPVAEWVVAPDQPIEGAVALRSFRTGALLDRRDLRFVEPGRSPRPRGRHELTLPVGRRRTPGDLQPGDRVTLLAFDDRTGSIEVAVEDAAVLRFDGGDPGLGSSGEARLTLALESAAEAMRAVRGSHATLSVVRTTTVIDDEYPSEALRPSPEAERPTPAEVGEVLP